jgi:hypothetical protein
MTFMQLYLSCAGGIVVSILIPVVRAAVGRAFPADANSRNGGQVVLLPQLLIAAIRGLWPLFRPYAILCVFSLLVAIVIVAFLQEKLVTWQSAFLAGYVWDATLQKIAGKPA